MSLRSFALVLSPLLAFGCRATQALAPTTHASEDCAACAQTARPGPLVPDPSMACDTCADWNRPREPFRVHGNTYFVGTAGLSSVLIVDPAGSVLLDGGLTQSAPLIAENIRRLGFKLEDVRLLLNSHTHFDHAGGLAALQRASGAKVMASPASERALEGGSPTPDDPQFGFGHDANAFPPMPAVEVVRDGQAITVGALSITALFTPGHTPGGTSWTWRSCEGANCLDIVYADSLTPISAPGFRYSGSTDGDRVATFRASIDRIAGLPCDILLAPHPTFLDLDGKLALRQQSPTVDPFIDPEGCKRYAAGALERLGQRLNEERTGGGT